MPRRRKSSQLVLFALRLGLAAPLLAAPTRVGAQTDQGYSTSIEVSVIDVVVVVRDKAGKPVTGLKPENFRIESGGSPQEVTNFLERRGDASALPNLPEIPTPSPLPSQSPVAPIAPPAKPRQQNRVVFFFDNLHLQPLSRNWLIDKIGPAVDEMFDGETQGMVIAFNRKLEVIQPFTADLATVRGALDKAGKRGSEGMFRSRERDRIRERLMALVAPESTRGDRSRPEDDRRDEAQGAAESYVSEQEADLKRTLNGLLAVADLLSGVEGRKALVFISEGIESNPASEVFSFLDQAFPRGNMRLNAMNHDQTNLLKKLTERCNAFGITLYPVSAQGLGIEGATTAEQNRPWDPRFRGAGMGQLAQVSVREAANLLADDTGGRAILSTNNFDGMLRRVSEDLQFYYSLGITAPPAVGKTYDLEVELVGVADGYDARVRRAFRSFGDEERIEQKVLAQLAFPSKDNPLAVKVSLPPISQMKNGEALVTLNLYVPWRNLVLIQEGQEYKGGLEAYVAVKDDKGDLSAVRKLAQDLLLPAQYYAAAQSESYRYELEVPLRPGAWTLSVAMRDTVSKTTSYISLNKLVEAPRAK